LVGRQGGQEQPGLIRLMSPIVLTRLRSNSKSSRPRRAFMSNSALHGELPPIVTLTDKQAAKIEAWHREDPCFGHLNLLRLACLTADADLVEKARTSFDHHFAECGECWEKLLVEAERTTDGFKRRIYFSVVMLTQFEFMRFQGGDYAIEQTAGETRIRFVYPADYEERWTGCELMLSSDPSMESYLILDLRRAEDFENPGYLLQRVDELDSTHVRTFDSNERRPALWWPVVSDRRVKLKARWQGLVKVIAPDTTLHGRYQGLVRCYLSPESSLGGERVRTSSRDRKTEEVLKILEIARKYDGQSYFAGNTQKTLEYRKIDEYRHNRTDGLFHAVDCGNTQTPSDSGGQTDGPADAINLEPRDEHAERADELAHVEIVRGHLESHLTERQRMILRIRNENPDLSDRQVAEMLDVVRETVSRDRADIRKIAEKVLPK
jgi:hypothetical protein